MNSNQVLENLEWHTLLKKLISKAQTDPAREALLKTAPNLDAAHIEQGWVQQISLRELVKLGYVPPIGDLPELSRVFKGASLGQILEGPNFRDIYNLLDTTRHVSRFLSDFEAKCKPLATYRGAIYPLPKLQEQIEKAIAPDGALLDTASEQLYKIRQQKLSQRKRIESEIRQILVSQDLETYLQDKFFTIRSDRYVVPMRLDGRGRIKGSIYDTSDSGQTLYIEPQAITSLNDALLELEVSEKLEIIKIFRNLSALIATDLEIIITNYEKLVELDVLTAKGLLAAELGADRVSISTSPTLNIIEARHPLLEGPAKTRPIANNISMKRGLHLGLIVSGPNAGGKTVVLKTVGILHLMLKAGLLIPASEKSEMYLFKDIFLAMGDPQSIEASLSTFSGHLLTLKPILERSSANSLVLLDELAVGTDPQTGSAIAQAILEGLVDQSATTLCTTHFDSLKTLAVADQRFRNGSMEFSTGSLKPTYNLVLDVPGQSYGLEVAEQLGLPEKVITRAKNLKGHTSPQLDGLIRSLTESKDDAVRAQKKYETEHLKMQAQKHHWESEREELKETKKKAAEKLGSRYESSLNEMQQKIELDLKRLQKIIKETERGDINPNEARSMLRDSRKDLKEQASELSQTLANLNKQHTANKKIPGKPCTREDLKLGDIVYVISLGKEAKVSKIPEGNTHIEVQAGLLKLRPSIQEIRLLEPMVETPPKKKLLKVMGVRMENKSEVIGYTPSTRSNTLDLRGHDQESALSKLWMFIDRAIMGGRSHLVIIHGHGTDTLKKLIRSALVKDSPYKLDFRPGNEEEGGDGVTVIKVIG